MIFVYILQSSKQNYCMLNYHHCSFLEIIYIGSDYNSDKKCIYINSMIVLELATYMYVYQYALQKAIYISLNLNNVDLTLLY